MNQLDMHTREKINQLHIAEMQHEARNRRLSRHAYSSRIPARAKLRLVMVGLALLAVAFVLAANVSF